MRQELKSKPPAPKSLVDLPLIVITAEKRNTQSNLELMELEKQQKELVALSRNSKHVIAHSSGHYIMYDVPELIVNEIIALNHWH
ncbi:MAG: hypothetical protein ABW170_17880 [Candidatus Thiodiazotropha sp. L084R]